MRETGAVFSTHVEPSQSKRRKVTGAPPDNPAGFWPVTTSQIAVGADPAETSNPFTCRPAQLVTSLAVDVDVQVTTAPWMI